jgi:hypothetical protein
MVRITLVSLFILIGMVRFAGADDAVNGPLPGAAGYCGLDFLMPTSIHSPPCSPRPAL